MITIKNIKNWFKIIYEEVNIGIFVAPMLCIFFVLSIAYFYNRNNTENNINMETKENIFWKSNRNFDFIITEKSIDNKDIAFKSRFINNNEGFNDKEVYLIFNYIDGVNLNVGDTISVTTSYSKLYQNTEKYIRSYDIPIKILKPENNNEISGLTFLGMLLLLGISVVIIYIGGSMFDTYSSSAFENGSNSISLKFIILGAGLILAFFVKSCQ